MLKSRERFALVVGALKLGDFGSDLNHHARVLKEELGEAFEAARRLNRKFIDLPDTIMVGEMNEGMVQDAQDLAFLFATLKAADFTQGKGKVSELIEEGLANFAQFAIHEGYYKPDTKQTVYKGGEDDESAGCDEHSGAPGLAPGNCPNDPTCG